MLCSSRFSHMASSYIATSLHVQYNLAQFLIYDKNRNGLVSVEETMNLLYAR
jgi:hypothetical protein